MTKKELEIENNIYKAALEKILNYADFANEIYYPDTESLDESMAKNLGRIASEILFIDEKISNVIARLD